MTLTGPILVNFMNLHQGAWLLPAFFLSWTHLHTEHHYAAPGLGCAGGRQPVHEPCSGSAPQSSTARVSSQVWEPERTWRSAR